MWAFLFAAVGPLAIRALTVLGFSAVTFTGITAVVDSLVSQAQTSFSALPAAVLALASIAGVPQCLGLLFGAFVARTTLWVGTSAVKMVFKGV
jgi:hypothetical protein